jgi:hypothetical protein
MFINAMPNPHSHGAPPSIFSSRAEIDETPDAQTTTASPESRQAALFQFQLHSTSPNLPPRPSI